MRNLRSHAPRAAPYSAIERHSPTATAAAATPSAPFHAPAAVVCQLPARSIAAALVAIAGAIATSAQANPSVARSECASVSREHIRLKPSTGLRRSSFGAAPANVTPPVCTKPASTPASDAPPATSSATPRTSAQRGVITPRVAATIEPPAAAASAGATAIAVTAAAANETLAENSLDLATFPSRFALAMRRGVASNGFSQASLTARLRARRSRVITIAAANDRGKASVKLPNRGTTRESAPSAICMTNANPTAGAAICSATSTKPVAKLATKPLHADGSGALPGCMRAKLRAKPASVKRYAPVRKNAPVSASDQTRPKPLGATSCRLGAIALTPT